VAVPGHGPEPLVVTTGDGGDTGSPARLPDPPIGGSGVQLATSSAAQLLVERGRLLLTIDLTTPGRTEFSHWTSVSQDGGRTWVRWVKAPASTNSPYAAPLMDDRGRLVVADDHLLLTSADGGRTWQERLVGLPAADHALGMVFAGAGVLMVLAEGPPPSGLAGLRLLRSVDGGARWTEVRPPARPVS
jgi:hypothetical protein